MLTAASYLSILFLALALATSEADFCSAGLYWCAADEQEDWNYNMVSERGPRFWGRNYPNCNGNMQSPINIATASVEKNENLAPLKLQNYDVSISEATIENNGHTIEVIPQDDVSRRISVNGKTYSLQQFHFHWGCDGAEGSEHSVDGDFYAMEMHLVHTNEDGEIAVVGVFLDEQEGDEGGQSGNEELQKIVNQLSDVRYKGSETHLSSNVNLNNLLPSNPISYYRYQGSLTTPGCTEGVTWSVIPTPIDVGNSQMEVFRSLYSTTKEKATMDCKLAGNYRPVQQLNGRTVYLSQ
nr:venom protein [Lampona murina]